MATQKKQFVEELWKQFTQKISKEWDEKYREFGEIFDLNQIDRPFKFAGTVHSNIISYFKKNHFKDNDIISVDALNNMFLKKGLSENTKFKTLDLCARYVGYKDWDDFIQLNSRKISNADEDNYNMQTSFNENLSLEEKQYFIYYYIDTSFKPDKSLLVISKNIAELTTFHTDAQDKKYPNIVYEGVITNSERDEMSIHFTKEKRGDKGYLTANPSFCCFENNFGDKRLGVFAATGKTISCGIVIIEETSQVEYMDKINGRFIPPAIHSIIHNARLFPSGYYHSGDFFEKNTRIINTVKDHAGVYEGYTIISQGALSIQKIALEMSENGNVRFKSNGRPDGQSGRVIDVRKGKNLVMQFSLNKVHNYYKIQIVLDLHNNKVKSEASGTEKPLIGIYGGIEETSESPMAGRIILFPIEKEYEEMQFELIPISDEQKVKQLFDEKKQKGKILRKFFRGELDEFVDPPILLEKCSLLSAIPTEKK